MSAPPGKFDLASLAKSLKDAQSGPDSPRLLEVIEKNESLAWKIEYQEQKESEAAEASLGSPAMRRKLTPMTASMSRSLSSKKKIIFETLSESAESDSLEEPIKESEANPDDIDLDDLGDIDVSSSSEIEIDEPVTTPQIEALMFNPGSNQAEANLSSPDTEVTIRESVKGKMNASLPTYDLNKLFSGVQDSGGEAMILDENIMVLSDSSQSRPMEGSTISSMTSWSDADLSSSS